MLDSVQQQQQWAIAPAWKACSLELCGVMEGVVRVLAAAGAGNALVVEAAGRVLNLLDRWCTPGERGAFGVLLHLLGELDVGGREGRRALAGLLCSLQKLLGSSVVRAVDPAPVVGCSLTAGFAAAELIQQGLKAAGSRGGSLLAVLPGVVVFGRCCL